MKSLRSRCFFKFSLIPLSVIFYAGAEPSPALLVASCSRKRVRKGSKDAGTKAEETAPKIKGKPGRKPKPKPGGEVFLNQLTYGRDGERRFSENRI